MFHKLIVNCTEGRTGGRF